MRLRVIYTGTVNNYSDTWLALNAAQALDSQVLFMRTVRQTDTLGAGEAAHYKNVHLRSLGPRHSQQDARYT